MGGAATTWSGTTLKLLSGTAYSINTKSSGGDFYDTLQLSTQTDIRSWNSRATTTITAADSSLYSQDNAAVDGNLNIYGDLTIATTTEYWNYATDFDGTTLVGGARRAVSVRMQQNATTTLQGGALEMIGAAGASTSVVSSAGTYTLAVTGGTFTANYFSFANLAEAGLSFTGEPNRPSWT